MMQLYPAHAAEALEFNKVCDLLYRSAVQMQHVSVW